MEVYFKSGDIVWVKLGPFWWPGEIAEKSDVPEEVTNNLKKEPIAIVKFFDEDYYECVKTADCIYHYNCERKNDFIKKGMDAYRSNNPKMASFPKDVSAAEEKTGGNINITNDPMFTPERKRMAQENIKTSSIKKSKSNNKGRTNKIPNKPITHRRFLGFDDYQSCILIQYPGKDKTSDTEEDAAPTPTLEEPSPTLVCPTCQFSTDKRNILKLHQETHGDMPTPTLSSSLKKSQKRKRKKALIDEEGEDKKTKTKRKYKKRKPKESIEEKDGNEKSNINDNVNSETISEGKKDVCDDIIADWDDESNQDSTEEVSVLNSTLNETDKLEGISAIDTSTESVLDSTIDTTQEDKSVSGETTSSSKKQSTQKTNANKKKTDANISCFDFDEEEEITKIPDVTTGRKIPRVIPISDKRKSFSYDDMEDNENEEEKKKILKESEQLSKSIDSDDKNNETDEFDKTYQSLMDSTSKIELPDIPNILKSEQNFHCAKTVKYPDKLGDPSEEGSNSDLQEKLNKVFNQTDSIEEKTSEENKKDKPSKQRKSTSKKGNTSYTSRTTRSSKPIDESEIDKLLAQYTSEAEKNCIEDDLEYQENLETSSKITKEDDQNICKKLFDDKVEGDNVIPYEEIIHSENVLSSLDTENKKDELSLKKQTKVTRKSKKTDDSQIVSKKRKNSSDTIKLNDEHSSSSEITKEIKYNEDNISCSPVAFTNLRRGRSRRTLESSEIDSIDQKHEEPTEKNIKDIKESLQAKDEIIPPPVEEESTSNQSIKSNEDKQHKKRGRKSNRHSYKKEKKSSTDVVINENNDDKSLLESKDEKSEVTDIFNVQELEETQNVTKRNAKKSRLSKTDDNDKTELHETSLKENQNKDVSDKESSSKKGTSKQKYSRNSHRSTSRRSSNRDQQNQEVSSGKKEKTVDSKEDQVQLPETDVNLTEIPSASIKEDNSTVGQIDSKTSVENISEAKESTVTDIDNVISTPSKSISKHSRKLRSSDHKQSSTECNETIPRNSEKLNEVQTSKSSAKHTKSTHKNEKLKAIDSHDNIKENEKVNTDLKIEMKSSETDKTKNDNLVDLELKNNEVNKTEIEDIKISDEIHDKNNDKPQESNLNQVNEDKSDSKKHHRSNRYDQKEKPVKRERKTRWDQIEIPVESKEEKKIEESSSLDLSLFETTQNEQSSLDQEKMAEIESIFGSLPSQQLNEEKSQDNEQNQISSYAKDQLKLGTEEKEEPLKLLSDAFMDSLESQVAQITHYEETKDEETKDFNDVVEASQMKELENELSDAKEIESNIPIKEKESSSLVKPVFKAKKNYLLVTKSKLEKVDDKLNLFQETQSPSKSTSEKSSDNEASTKLINPKKRFVKSFEDYELNKLKEKSIDSPSTDIKHDRVETKVSSITGKSPIAFKLKKQFLSKITNVFDESNEDKNKKQKSSAKSSLETIPTKKEALNQNKELKSDKTKDLIEVEDKDQSATKSSDIKKKTPSLSQQEENFTVPEQNFLVETSTSNILTDVESFVDNIDCFTDDTKTKIITKNFPLDTKEEPELVPIDGNLTLISEKELAEGQVELTASSSSNKKPITLMNFSLDFSDEINDNFDIKKQKATDAVESKINKNLEDHSKTSESIENISKQENNKDLITATKDELESGNLKKTETKVENETITIENLLGNKESISLFKEIDNGCNTKVSNSSDNLEVVKTISKTSEDKNKEPKKNERKISKVTEEISIKNEPIVFYNTAKSSTVTDMCDLEEHIPSQIVCAKNAINEEVIKVTEMKKDSALPKVEPTVSKLLSRLSTEKPKDDEKLKATEADLKIKEIDMKSLKLDPNATKTLIKAAIKNKSVLPSSSFSSPVVKSGNKAIILSEKIIRPARDVSSLNITSKNNSFNTEDTFMISTSEKSSLGKIISQTPTKSPGAPARHFTTVMPKTFGKAKILNQTIIRPASEIVQPKTSTSLDDNIDFDINSMPIVLSDEILTPESLENMPIVLGENIQNTSTDNIRLEKKLQYNNTKVLNKTITMQSGMHSISPKFPLLKKTQTSKVSPITGTPHKIIRHVSPALATSKPGKYLIVPENTSKSSPIAKKTNIIRKPIANVSPNVTSESTGHKIMIVTNQQGQQQRLLLTPAHQKMFGMQIPKTTKTIVKNAVTQKTSVGKSNLASSSVTSKIQPQTISSPKLTKTTLGGSQLLSSPSLKQPPVRKVQKTYSQNSPVPKAIHQKTILIKNQLGQTVRKIQGTDDALLDKQVAEQLEAIKVSSMKAQQRQHELSIKPAYSNTKTVITKRCYPRKAETKQNIVTHVKPAHSTASISGNVKTAEQVVPPLSSIKSDKKTVDVQKRVPEVKSTENKNTQRPLNRLIFQDGMGNETSFTEGQILALPNETVDGQPHSYMLVTVDESGNLAAINNETLMSLDPSLAGSDLSNIVLQVDPGLAKDGVSQSAQLQIVPPTPAPQIQKKSNSEHLEVPDIIQQEVVSTTLEQTIPPVVQNTSQVQVTCNINGEPGQQIILTGDPVATQKFLDSLSEGNTDLANILANAEGSSFLIQADGQQILINTESNDTQMLQTVANIPEQNDEGNPVFATHSVKNQDILAAALADTDVFQQEQVANQNKVLHSQLSPGQTLFPINVGNNLETSFTLNSPIMTPLEVPSTNSKKIPDEEADILTTQVAKNVDLPITITDPNIAQTVSHQQVLMTNDLQTNLELSLPISENSMSVASGMNSPSFVYSLPNLDVGEHAEISQKSFSSSMPLLTEDMDESSSLDSKEDKQESLIVDRLEQNTLVIENTSDVIASEQTIELSLAPKKTGRITSDGTFMEEGLCTLGGEMCSSLSEPPPEMFDIPISSDGFSLLGSKSQNESDDKSSPIPSEPTLITVDNELQQIDSDLRESYHSTDSSSSVSDEKTV